MQDVVGATQFGGTGRLKIDDVNADDLLQPVALNSVCKYQSMLKERVVRQSNKSAAKFTILKPRNPCATQF